MSGAERGRTDTGAESDGRIRCPWSDSSALYREYHDFEWGKPVHGRDPLFERVCLETFQAGLSWITVLRKREAFRSAFAGFAVELVAAFDDADVERLLADPGIVRNRAKILACIANARLVADMTDELDELLWSFAPDSRPRPASLSDVPAITPESTAMARELKRRGFAFVGPTTAYALMQATGMVDDHLADCWVPQK
ncbi:MAG: DNA-3-methyladenine glycosylase I [Mycobacteriaceae bacterium]|nr:DNA-3-methyladenine glycosylase I [Mycobacteriaceae bacterium]